MIEYRCIKKLVVPELEEYDGAQTGNDFIVDVEEVWFDDSSEYSGSLSNYDGRWLQIEKDTLDEHFEALEGEE